MRRVLAAILALALLAGCGAPAGRDQGGGQGTPPEGLVLELEHEVYDPSLTRYTYFVRNGTGEAVELGEDVGLEYREGEQWKTPSWWDGGAWDAVAYRLEPGAAVALTCYLGGEGTVPERGTYRLVKEVGGHTLYGEFQVGESPYTAGTPYGFGRLEELAADGAPGELDVVLSRGNVGNLEAVEDFLFKLDAGADCQLRIVQDYGKRTVKDVIFENRRFLCRERSGEGAVSERWFSFLVTDGTGLYLSNAADWKLGEQYEDQREKLIPGGIPEELTAAAARSAAGRLEAGGVHYRLWSADGLWSAALTEFPTEFLVEGSPAEGGFRSERHDLLDWDGTETDILGLEWEEGDTLLLNCETLFGGRSRILRYDPETDDMTSVQGVQSWESIYGLPAAGKAE